VTEQTQFVMEAPNAVRVQELAHEAVRALRAAQTHVIKEAEAIVADREALAADRGILTRKESDLGRQRKELEAQLADIVRVSADLETRTASIARIERETDAKARELEPKKQDLERREQELRSWSEQVEVQTAEMTQTREVLTDMQAQLEHDHKEVSAHRDELLQRLSQFGPRTAPPVPAAPVEPEKPSAAHPSGRSPKPAVAQAVDQFRKLRRDAKRKAIGV